MIMKLLILTKIKGFEMLLKGGIYTVLDDNYSVYIDFPELYIYE